MSPIKDTPIVLYEDNIMCIAQIKEGCIKSGRSKHISPKFSYMHKLQNSGEINIQQIRLNDYQGDLFTKVLPTTTFKKSIHLINMC